MVDKKLLKKLTPEFYPGEKVQIKNDPEICTILDFSFNAQEDEIFYRLNSKDWDPVNRVVLEGVKTARASEIIKYEEPKE